MPLHASKALDQNFSLSVDHNLHDMACMGAIIYVHQVGKGIITVHIRRIIVLDELFFYDYESPHGSMESETFQKLSTKAM